MDGIYCKFCLRGRLTNYDFTLKAILPLVLTLALLLSREESILEEIQAIKLHGKMQDPSFFEEAQLIDVREPDEVYDLMILYDLSFFLLFFNLPFD